MQRAALLGARHVRIQSGKVSSLAAVGPRLPCSAAPSSLAWCARGCSSASDGTTGAASKVTAGQRKAGDFDATAAKPTKVCDPYENKGQPLSAEQCAALMPTVSDAWTLTDDSSALVREIEVNSFMKGAKLLTTLAAVSFNDGHFPLLTLERRVGRKRRWQEFVLVRCQTVVLEGLSFRDFQLAVLMDVELAKSQR
jgi:pterin-4a-carbinolamine dehydratase